MMGGPDERQRSENYSQFNAGLDDPGNIHNKILAGAGKVYTEDARPRAIRADSEGFVEIIDNADPQNTVGYNMLKGEVLPMRPIEITTNTTIDVQVFW